MMVVASFAVGPRFRFKLGRSLMDSVSLTLQHHHQDRIEQKRYLTLADLHRDMSIAKVIRGARKSHGIRTLHDSQFLRSRAHPHDGSAIRRGEEVPIVKHQSTFEAKQHFAPARCGREQAALASIFERQEELTDEFRERLVRVNSLLENKGWRSRCPSHEHLK
jgi:hypothetical protein